MPQSRNHLTLKLENRVGPQSNLMSALGQDSRDRVSQIALTSVPVAAPRYWRHHPADNFGV
jgi:hypothetical protein